MKQSFQNQGQPGASTDDLNQSNNQPGSMQGMDQQQMLSMQAARDPRLISRQQYVQQPTSFYDQQQQQQMQAQNNGYQPVGNLIDQRFAASWQSSGSQGINAGYPQSAAYPQSATYSGSPGATYVASPTQGYPTLPNLPAPPSVDAIGTLLVKPLHSCPFCDILCCLLPDHVQQGVVDPDRWPIDVAPPAQFFVDPALNVA